MPYTKFQRARIDGGFCKDCGAKRETTGTGLFCRRCADARSIRAANRKAALRAVWRKAGDLVCNGCGRPLLDAEYTHCPTCRAYSRERWCKTAPAREARKRAARICRECSEPTVGKSRSCVKHFVVDVVRKGGGNTKLWRGFWEKLEAQNFKCYYTGLALTPGSGDCSLDHKVPRSRGGALTVDNSAWCHRRINALKGNSTTEEFVEMCRMVVEKFS